MSYKRQTFVDETSTVEGTKLKAEHFNHIEDWIVESERCGYSHFSIDDFYLAFQDLTENVANYKSIFDNATFAWFKTFHEKTGGTISCYCFYEAGDFTLDMVPTKFAAEFKANSDWLRFGFHALKNGINYASATAEKAKEDYEKTIAALVKITGSTRCIDRIPRLHNFAGALEACRGMRDAKCGTKGFLAAIANSDGTPRQSYYLEEAKNNYIYIHDYLYDATEQLHFVRTQDGGMVYKINELVNGIDHALWNTYVEIFTHENQLTDGTKSAYISAYNNLKSTHKPVFWMDILR